MMPLINPLEIPWIMEAARRNDLVNIQPRILQETAGFLYLSWVDTFHEGVSTGLAEQPVQVISVHPWAAAILLTPLLH